MVSAAVQRNDTGRGLLIADVAAAFGTNSMETLSWAVLELERLRPTAVDGCCYAVSVHGPGLCATGYLFSPHEPVDWTICCCPANAPGRRPVDAPYPGCRPVSDPPSPRTGSGGVAGADGVVRAARSSR